ncbi:uncharacterized protein LOC128225978 [Mya arenaria]|uniref:uncharacterized protein LOC128225978 n=1 Tax=Mya arenaria TaxID=6604 RepID=UPI0022E6E93D|nr:uncharacterized protein LOC128225978 [Mya arenaria]
MAIKLELLVLFAVVVAISSAGNVPAGFIPLPPLPVRTPPPTKQPPKQTFATASKKPFTTKAPYKPPTTQKPAPTTKKTLPTTQKPLPTTQKPIPTTQTPAPVNTAPSNCGLNVNVPKANCINGNVNVQQALDALRQQLSATRQQHQAQNSAVQNMVSNLQSRQSGYLTKISDLQSEVQNLVSAFNNICTRRPSSTTPPATVTMAPTTNTPTSSGVSQLAFLQAIQAVRSDMGRAVLDFNNRVFNVNTAIQNHEQQEMTVHQGIESKIQKQASDIGRLSQQVASLTGLLAQLNTSSGQPAAGSTAADVAKLKQEIAKVSADVQKYDQAQQAKVASLSVNSGALAAQVANHSTDITILRTNLQLDQARLRNVEKDVTQVHDSLAIFRQQINPQLSSIQSDVGTLKANMSALDRKVTSINKSSFNLFNQYTQDKASLSGLVSKSASIQGNLSSIQHDLGQQTLEIKSIQSGMVALKAAIPIAELTKMNSLLNSTLANNGTWAPQDIMDFQAAITSIQTNLRSLKPNLGPSSG